jgi:ABC-type taurine transport system substrate-binding protein
MIAVIGVWFFLTSVLRMIPPAFLPPPQNIVTDFLRILESPYVGHTLVGHALVSLQIVLGGFFSALLIGIPLGIKDPKKDLKGKTFLVSTLSTGHYAVVAYLKKIGLKESDVKIVHMEQSAILSAFLSGQGDVAQTWAPFNYMMEEKGMKVLSHGKDAGVVIPGGVVATKKFADEKPELVAKWLEGYQRGVDFMIDNPRESAKHLGKYFREKCGINLSDEVCLKEFELRPLFRTKQQIRMFERKGGKMSTVDKWMDDLAQYFVEVKKIDAKPDPKTYITDKFLYMVDQKAKK